MAVVRRRKPSPACSAGVERHHLGEGSDKAAGWQRRELSCRQKETVHVDFARVILDGHSDDLVLSGERDLVLRVRPRPRHSLREDLDSFYAAPQYPFVALSAGAGRWLDRKSVV